MGSSPEILSVLAGLSLLLSALATASSSTLAALGEHRAAALLEEGKGSPGLSTVVRRSDSVRLALLTLDGLAKLALGGLVVAVALGHPIPGLVLGGSALVAIVVLTTVRALAARKPERSLRMLAPFAAGVDIVLRPLMAPLSALARWARGNAGPLQGTTEEIEYLIEVGAKQGVLEEAHRDLLESVLDFSSVRVREIMVPRPKVVSLDVNAPYEEVLRVVTESEHSRLPVYEGSIDNVIGILYARRLLKVLRPGPDARATFRLRAHLSDPYFIPESMKISLLLAEFQRRRTHIAVVVDEFGGTSGVVTLEDVVEEIVGEIRDETDGEEVPVRRAGEGTFVADGGISLRDLEGFLEELLPSQDRFEFPEDGDYETLAGFVTARTGRVPEPGDQVREDGLIFTVRAADQKRVTRVEIARVPAPSEGEEPEEGREAPPAESRRETRGL